MTIWQTTCPPQKGGGRRRADAFPAPAARFTNLTPDPETGRRARNVLPARTRYGNCFNETEHEVRHMHFHWIALKYFRETVRSKSIRKAAERLHVVPSAVNRQIINLEKQIGTPLFDRLPQGMRMTAAGEVFFRHVLTMQGDLDRALSEIDNLRGARRGHVTIACEEGLAKELLPKIVASFSTSHAGVTFAVLVEDMPSVVARVADGTADVGTTVNPDR